MKTINLKYVYPQIYNSNYYLDVTNEVYYLLKQNKETDDDYTGINFLNEPISVVEQSLCNEELIKNLYHYLSLLPLKQQNRIYERYFLDLKYVDIARIEGCTEAAVRKSICRGITQLKKKICLYYFHRGW